MASRLGGSNEHEKQNPSWQLTIQAFIVSLNQMNRVKRLKFRCKKCRRIFLRRPKETLRHSGATKYCSMKCRGLAMRRQENLVCANCVKKFSRCHSEVSRRGKLSWCSWNCWKEYYNKHRKSYPKIGSRHAHRIVAERKFGRRLTPKDIVHHRDGDKNNYKPNNLQLTDRVRHAKIHFTGRGKNQCN